MDSDEDAPLLDGAFHSGDAALAAYGVPGVEQPGGGAAPPFVSNSAAAAAALAAAAANGGKIPRGSTGLGGPPPGARGGGPASAPGGSFATGSEQPRGPRHDVSANPYLTAGALPPFGAHGRDFDQFWEALDHHWSVELPASGAPMPTDYATRKFGVPTVCSDRLNLASLYREVCLRGGHAAVGEAKWWKRVGSALAGVEAATRSTALGTVLKYAYEKWLLTFEQAHFDASRHADEIARVQAATTAMRALGRLPPTRRRPSSAGGAAPLGGVALGDFGVAAAGPAAGTAAAAPPAASEAFRSPSAPAAAAPPPGFEDAFARRLQQQEAAAANAANAAAAAAAAAAAVFSTARPVSAAAVPPSRPPPPPPPSSSSFAPANASRMAAAPRAVAERAALEMIMALSAPRPGPAIAVGGGWERSPALGEAGCALVAFESPRAVNWALNVLGVVAASARPPLDLEAAPESVCAGLLSVMARGIGSGEAGGREKEESENDQNGPPTPGRKRKALVPASSEPPFWVPPKRRPFCCDAVATALAGGKKDEEKPASSQSPPWWLATSLAAADGGDGAAAWGCAAASVLRNAALTCAASASRLARPDAVAALCGVLEEAAGSAGSRGSPAANEAAADALDILICAAPSISVSAVSEANSSPAPPPSFSRTLTSKQASRLAEALLSLLGPSLQAGAESTQPLPLKLRIGAARVVAGLARGPGAAAAVLDCRPASSLSPSPSPPPPPHASPSCVSASSTSQRFAAAVAALVSSSTPAEARVSLKLAAAGACGPSEVSPKDLGTAALKAAGAALHADAVSAGASALAALLSRRVKVVAAADGGAPSDGRTALAPGALAAAELVLRSPLLLRALAAAACGRLPEIPRTVAGGAPTGELAEAAARAAGAAADAGATCLMAAVAGRASAVVAGALGPFASALAARAVSLPAAASSGRLATNLNSLIGAVEAARLRLVASRK